MTTKPKTLSACCEAKAKPNVNNPGAIFCTQCGQDCEPSSRKAPFKPFGALSVGRKTTGERDLFVDRWHECKGLSEISGEPLLPPTHPMFHAQGCHLLPKGSYQDARLVRANVVMTTVHEHTVEWPLVKEKTDAEIVALNLRKWIPKVTLFRALRLRYNQRLNAELSGKA